MRVTMCRQCKLSHWRHTLRRVLVQVPAGQCSPHEDGGTCDSYSQACSADFGAGYEAGEACCASGAVVSSGQQQVCGVYFAGYDGPFGCSQNVQYTIDSCCCYSA